MDSASLTVDCKGRDACALEVHYAISNPTDAAISGTAVFYGLSTIEMHVTVDGKPANVPIDTTAATAFDASVDSVSEHKGSSIATRDERQGFTIAVAPRATAAIVITGTLVANIRRGYDGYAPMADRARHMVLTPDPPKDSRIELDYLVAPIRTWGKVPEKMAFTFVHPADWGPYLNGAEDIRVTTAGDGRTVRTGTIPTTLDKLAIDVYLGDMTSWLRGGVFAAIGGNVDDATGTRTRFGVESALRRSYFVQLALEIESGSPTGYIVVPALHAATPWLIVIPSLGAGLGVPMRVSPSFEIGGRFQLDAHVGPLGYFVAFDWYPGMEADPRRFEVSMMAVLSI